MCIRQSAPLETRALHFHEYAGNGAIAVDLNRPGGSGQVLRALLFPHHCGVGPLRICVVHRSPTRYSRYVYRLISLSYCLTRAAACSSVMWLAETRALAIRSKLSVD